MLRRGAARGSPCGQDEHLARAARRLGGSITALAAGYRHHRRDVLPYLLTIGRLAALIARFSWIRREHAPACGLEIELKRRETARQQAGGAAEPSTAPSEVTSGFQNSGRRWRIRGGGHPYDQAQDQKRTSIVVPLLACGRLHSERLKVP